MGIPAERAIHFPVTMISGSVDAFFIKAADVHTRHPILLDYLSLRGFVQNPLSQELAC